MKNKILILETRALSYESSHVFLSEIARWLQEEGVETEHRVISDIEKESDVLEQYIGRDYLAVLDINSHLPFAEIDGTPYPDLIDAPFINILVDHPLHLHPMLRIPLKRGILVCLDSYHAEYVKWYYPHHTVWHRPLAGTKAQGETGFSDRKIKLLFAGTYTPSAYFWEQMDDDGREIADRMQQSITAELGKENVSGCIVPSFPEWYRQFFNTDDILFPTQMYHMRVVERYLREWKREQILGALLDTDIPVTVVGARWEQFVTKNRGALSVYPAVNYRQMLELFDNSRVVLNIQPNFVEAPHDRIANAIVNRSVCLTDCCEWLTQWAVPEHDYISFDFGRLQEQAGGIREILDDNRRLQEMAENAWDKGREIAGWDSYCKFLLAKLNFIDK